MLRLNQALAANAITANRDSNTTNVKVKPGGLQYGSILSVHSNTTNVKVKLGKLRKFCRGDFNSNTTNVKVKLRI